MINKMLKRTSKDVISDSEISRVIATHPKIDTLILLSQSDYDPYRLVKELGIGYRTCYLHLSILEKAGLIGSRRLKYCITEKGKQILSKMAQLND